MRISEFLTPQDIFPDLKATGKKQVLQELASFASERLGIEDRAIFDVLVERERLGTTGFGNGVAIPHGRMRQLDKLNMMFARLSTPVAFDAVDGRPVDLLFLLLTPENAGADHLTALAKASRILRDESLCAKLRGAETAEAIYSTILESEQE
ncbi:phosphotransferase system mannitol/fructose-specific IIA domain [Acetobacter sp. CAG:977]|nr:phosphotransferase system mannitol/fructose-specific IIA domain [Acetobacter sp. CAG:977]